MRSNTAPPPAGFTATRPEYLAPGGYILDVTSADGAHAILRFNVTNDGHVKR